MIKTMDEIRERTSHMLEKKLLEELSMYPLITRDDAWSRRRVEIRTKMFETDDWSDFKKWPVVTASLYSGRIPNTDAEEFWMRGSSLHDTLIRIDAIPENGTSIHQAYLLWWLGVVFPDECSPFKLENLTIAEFGGGYGEMYKFLYNLGHDGKYYVYDFPELLILQKYFLISNDVPLDEWHPCFTAERWLEAKNADLLVSLCALSEAPVLDRQIVDEIEPKIMAIRYQPEWDGVNNTEYFKNYADAHGMQAVYKEAPKFPNHTIVVMKKT